MAALLLLGVALLSPLAWRANFVLAWPALVLALVGDRSSRWPRVGLIIAGFLFVAGAAINELFLSRAEVKQLLAFRPLALGFVALAVLVAWTGRRRVGCAE